MMMPRLRILHELLREDGAIFISIDDNEQHRLRMLMDEIFGEQNFVTTIVWQKNFSPKNTAQFFSEDHDYVLVYARSLENFNINLLPRTEAANDRYTNSDNDPRGPWASSDLSARNYYSLGTYAITTPSGRVISGPPKGSYWRVSETKLREMIEDRRIWWGDDGNNMPRLKRFLSEVKDGIVPQTLWFYKDAGHTQDAKKELLSILDFANSDEVFITPKPTKLIRRILQIATDHDAGDIVLDSFAGSGTTGHAVLAQNAEDGGNRRFILVEQEPYAEMLTAERIRRVIAGVPGAKDEALQRGYGGNFTMLRLGPGLDHEQILRGESLPSYGELARYVFFTLTGEQIDDTQIDEARWYLGQSSRYEVYLIYQPEIAFLMRTALTYEWARTLGQPGAKARLVVASHKLVESELLREWRIEFCQLPFEIYRFRA
jgi:adenine-specific DNA-methyltransferase